MQAWLIRTYTWLLHLYPPDFYSKFGDEMQSVFIDTIADAAKHGNAALIRICWQELRDLPLVLLREHLRERSKSKMETRFKPSSWREFLLASAPFGVFALIFLLYTLNFGLREWIGAGLLAVLPILFLVGLVKGLPRWALPYLGVVASFLNLISFNYWIRFWEWLPQFESPILYNVISDGLHLGGLIVLTIIFVLIIAIVRPLRPFYNHLQQDWTLLSFALYGIMLFALLMVFEDHQFKETYELIALLVLMVGAWAYLHNSRTSQKMLILLASLTLTMGVVVIGKWMIMPSQPWMIGGNQVAIEEARLNALSSTIVTWGWLVIIVILTPALLSLFLRRDRILQTTLRSEGTGQ